MSPRAKRFVGGAVLIGALLALLILWPGAPAVLRPRVGQAPAGDTALATTHAEPSRQPVETEATRDVAQEPPGFFDIPEHAGIDLRSARLRGRVIDLAERPVGGVEVCRIAPRGVLIDKNGSQRDVPAQNLGCVTADAAGRFEIEGRLPFALRVRDDRYTTLFEGVASPELVGSTPRDPGAPSGARARSEPPNEVLVVVGLRIPLAGVVVDEHAAPIEGVRVTVQAIVAPSGLDLSSSGRVIPAVRTDALGAFAITEAAAVEEARIEFQAPGFVTRSLPVPAGGDGSMTVVLSRESAGPYVIRGKVVLEDGTPAVGAHVSTGVMASLADQSGFFAIDFEPWLKFRVDESAPTVVTAILPGLLPASLTLPSVNEARTSGWPQPILLRLSGEPLTIRGVVVDEHSEPVAGVLVEPADMTDFGLVSMEGMPAFGGVPRTQEELAGGGATRTGADGRFELRGLSDRTYTLRAVREPSLLCAVSDRVQAGDRNVRLVLDGRGLGTLAGRIVDRHGQGIAGVRVAVTRRRASALMIGLAALTDENGAFRITDVTTRPEFLRIEGATIVPELFRELDPVGDVEKLELLVGRRCRIQFDWSAWPGREDRLTVVDERAEPLMMMQLEGGGMGEVPSVAFQRGRTDVFVVSDAAAHAVVRRGEVEVTRIRLSLAAGELNVIKL